MALLTASGMHETVTPPRFAVPRGACDCHMHVFGPPDLYPPAASRSYTPRPAPFPAYRSVASTLGLERVVFVQPSAYGADNRCMLDAMATVGPSARGIAAVDGTASDDALRDMAASGVRGLRLNAVSRGLRDIRDIEPMLRDAVRRAGPLGWHVQIFADLDLIAALGPVLRGIGIPVVIDHMALARPAPGTAQPGFADLCELLAGGHCWVKLAGADRISGGDDGGFRDALPIMRALIAVNPDALVWGTDWPHTGRHGHAPHSAPPTIEYRPVDAGRLLNLLAEAAGDDPTLRRILVDNPARLYGF